MGILNPRAVGLVSGAAWLYTRSMGRGREGWWAMGLVTLGLALFWGYGPLDDDFIVYRYAQRWIEGGQLAFNTDQFIEGYTTPLWLMLIAGAMKLGLAPDLASQFFGILGLWGCLICGERLWARWFPRRFGWPVLLIALAPAMVFHALGGLGTVPLAALLMAFALAWQRARERGTRPWMAAGWLALACLMRAEALLFLPFFLLAEWRVTGGRRGLLRLASVALIPLAGWTLFRQAYYGEWLPNTYFTKHLGLAQELPHGWDYLLESTWNSGVGLWLLCCVPLVLGRSGQPLRTALARGVLLHGAYVLAVGGDYIDLARFFVPTLPLMLLLAGGVIDQGLRKHGRVLVGVAGSLLLLVARPFLLRADKLEIYQNNEGRWKQVGTELARALPEDWSVVLSPIGCVGYLSGLPIVDPLGLVHDAFRDLQPDPAVTLKGHQRHDADWVLAQNPAVYIPSNARLVADQPLWPLMWELDLVSHPKLKSNYRLYFLPIPSSYPLIFYLRNDLAPPPGARPFAPQ